MSPRPRPAAKPGSDALAEFVEDARLMLDPATAEALRRETEPRRLAQWPTLRALGVFELFTIRDPSLYTLVRDELAVRKAPHQLSLVVSQPDDGCGAK